MICHGKAAWSMDDLIHNHACSPFWHGMHLGRSFCRLHLRLPLLYASICRVWTFACHCCMQVLHTINSSPCMHVLTASVQWWLLTGNDAWVVE